MLDIQMDNLDFHFIRLIDESGQFIEYDLKKELAVNESNLEQEMLEQPSKYIYWSSVLERLKMYQENVELKLEITLANLDKRAREELQQQGVKPTKDAVEGVIKRQPEYETAHNNLLFYKHVVGRVTRIVKAFEQRKDMLQSYGKQIADAKVYGRGAGSRFEKHIEPDPFGQNQ